MGDLLGILLLALFAAVNPTLLAATTHDTILGKIRFVGSENVGTPGTVSQWQKGEFEVVWPKAVQTAPLVTTKPNWV